MKTTKILIALAGATALTAASLAPAAGAQPWRGGYERGYGQGERLTGRYDALEWQVRNAADEGRLAPGQADQLLRQWRVNQPLAWRVETGRASPGERNRVFRTMNRIESALQRSMRYSRYDDRHDGRWRR